MLASSCWRVIVSAIALFPYLTTTSDLHVPTADIDVLAQNIQTLLEPNQTYSNITFGDVMTGCVEHVIHTSPYNKTFTAVLGIFNENKEHDQQQPNSIADASTVHYHSRKKRTTPEAFYLVSLLKIGWHFINGIAKPFLKTYLVPIQLLFTYMAPKMLLKDCLKVDTAELLSARTLSPFTIQPGAQAFFWCAIDVITQVILAVKLLANMMPTLF